MNPRLIALVTLLAILTAPANAFGAIAPAGSFQQLNPPYLSEFPSAERVMTVMKTADPKETALRQMGAFDQLVEIIRTLSGRREFRGFLPDEARIIGVYQVARYNVGLAADKAFPGTPKPSTDTPYGYGRWDRRFGIEGIQTFKLLLSPAIKAEFDKIINADNARREARAAADRTAATPPQSSNTVTPGSTAEMRRCVESGRSQRICFSEVMNNGMYQLAGLSNLNQPPKPGFRMTGDYSSRGGFRLIFLPEKVTMICHAVPAQRLYSVEITDTQALVKIQNESKTVVFSLLPNGKLSGSGPIHVTGQVPVGTHTEETFGTTTQNTTRERQLAPGEERYYPNARRNGPVYTVQEDTTALAYGPTGTRTVTDYQTKSADCNLGLMNPDGPTPLPPDMENPMGILTTILSGAAVLMKGGSTQEATKEMLSLDKAPAPGIRMAGRYAGSSGFSITFHPESATLACGDAERALEYSIQRNGNQTLLRIQDGTSPIVLQLKPDGSLFGQGSVQVNGRRIVGTTEDPNSPFIFAPKVARCEVGTLVAGGQVSGTPLSTPATNNPATVTAPTSTESVSLVISSGIPVQPGAANPLAGKVVLVFKESFESILARAGWGQSAASGSPITAWARACEARNPACQQSIAQLRPYVVASGRLDANGSNTFTNAKTGTFYVFLDVIHNGQRLLWNVPIVMKPGTNAVTLDLRNTTPIGR